MPSYLIALLPIALFLGLVQLTRRKARIARSALAAIGVLAIGAALGAHWLQAALWDWTGLRLQPDGAEAGSLLAMLLFAAPLEEGVKVLLIWPWLRLGRIKQPVDGLLAATAAATGFGATETVLYLRQGATDLLEARSALGGVGHILFASLWGHVLGHQSKLHWLGTIWLASMGFHGLFDHIVFGRGAGTLVVAVLMAAFLFALGGLIIRDVMQTDSTPAFVQAPRIQDLSLQDLTRALRQRDQPLMLHWIFLGALVNTGVVVVSLAGAVYVGHQLGIDFAAANEGDMRSNGPLVLLGSAVMAAFPVAGYLIARASGSRSVLEPAMGAAASIALVVTLLSVAAPVAVVFALAVAPLAFGLACAGAWFGLAR